MAGFFLDFEAVRTVSSEYDAPRRSGPNVEQLVAENARRVVRDKQAQGATLTVVLQKAKGLQRVNGLLEGPRPDVFVTAEVENEELFTSPLRCVSRRPVVWSHAINLCPSHADVGGLFFDFDAPRRLTGGERLVEACIHYDTDYCDVSGEIPWSAKLLEFHDVARDAGVYIVPSTAYAGGLPDIMCYAMAKEARVVHDEQLKEFHGYVSMYQEREGTVGASGGTLSTRAAMASG